MARGGRGAGSPSAGVIHFPSGEALMCASGIPSGQRGRTPPVRVPFMVHSSPAPAGSHANGLGSRRPACTCRCCLWRRSASPVTLAAIMLASSEIHPGPSEFQLWPCRRQSGQTMPVARRTLTRRAIDQSAQRFAIDQFGDQVDLSVLFAEFLDGDEMRGWFSAAVTGACRGRIRAAGLCRTSPLPPSPSLARISCWSRREPITRT